MVTTNLQPGDFGVDEDFSEVELAIISTTVKLPLPLLNMMVSFTTKQYSARHLLGNLALAVVGERTSEITVQKSYLTLTRKLTRIVMELISTEITNLSGDGHSERQFH